MVRSVFIHIQTYARQANPAGNSVAQVIGEGLRDPEFSKHVDGSQPPRVLMGDPEGFEAEHDAHVAARATEVRTKKHGVRKRAIRVDRHTLATVVASYPDTWDQIRMDPDGRSKLEDWERRTLAWALERWGDQLRVAFAHDDEPHPHLHMWLLPDDPGADATTLHPGKARKARIERELKASGVGAREAVATGNRALKEEMRQFITDYWQDVGVPCGMTRDGPRRARLTRSQYLARQAEVSAMQEARIASEMALREAKAAETEAQSSLDFSAQMRAQATAQVDAAQLTAAEIVKDARAQAVDLRERAMSRGIEEGRSIALEEVSQLKAELDRMRRGLRSFIAPLRSLLEEVHAERGLLSRARRAFGEGVTFAKQLKALREALERTEKGYIGGRIGVMQRDADAPVLAAYRAAEEGPLVPSTEDAGQTVEDIRPGL